MKRLQKILMDYLSKGDGDYYQFDEYLFYQDCHHRDFPYRMVFSLGRGGEYLILYIYSSCSIPSCCRTAVAEYICRVNYGLPKGRFDLDVDGGSVRYRDILEGEKGFLTPFLLSQWAAVGKTSFQRYWPGLLDILEGKREVAVVLKEREEGFLLPVP